jgi:hypothetical protein
MPTVFSSPWFYQQFCDGNGDPLAGGYIRTRYAGTSNDKATYSDAAGTTPYDNPIDLDASGMPDAGPIFLQAGPYDFYVYDADDNLIATVEGINSLNNTTNVDTVDDLRALAAGEFPIVQTLGYHTVNDGGGWWYHWDATSTATDDGGGTIQPDSLPATGRWLAMLPFNREMNVRVFGAVCDGVTGDVSELQACDDWCDTNGCIIIIDSSIYIETNPTLTCKIKLLPSAQFRYGDFSPVIDVVIDKNDKTEHFNCGVGSVPVLNVNELYPAWFGEDITSHPITTAVFSALTNTKTKYLYETEVYDSLTVNGQIVGEAGADIAGAVNFQSGSFTVQEEIYGTAGADIRADVNMQSGTSDGIVIGADVGAATRTDDTEKVASVSAPAYDTDEENTTVLRYDNAVGNAVIAIGGSDSTKNAATKIGFYTAADAVTLQGTERGYFGSDGSFVVGAPTGGGKGAGTINAVAIYDDNILLTGYVLDKAFNPDYTLADWKKKNPVHSEEFEKRADWILDIDKHNEFIASRKMLPTFEDVESTGNIPSTGAMIQKLWEVVEIQAVHIKQLSDRLKMLEESCK